MLELINSVKLQDKIINTQKSVVFLYTNNELPEDFRKQFNLQLHQKE